MTRYWTHHWKNLHWRSGANPEYEPLGSSGSNIFRKRGVSRDDFVYIVSLEEGQLLLGGRMIVRDIVSRDEAVRIRNNPDLWDASEWIFDEQRTGTPLNLHRRLATAVSKKIRYLSSKSGPKELFFKNGLLDNQATRGVLEVSKETAILLDRIIEITDQLPRSGKMITVTENMLSTGQERLLPEPSRLPEEVSDSLIHIEGSVQRIQVNRYERDPKAREACILHYGTICVICAFDFSKVYGDEMKGFIHVHHLRALSSIGLSYQVDPIKDLRPVCPNCHAAIHQREPPYSIQEIRNLLKARKV